MTAAQAPRPNDVPQIAHTTFNSDYIAAEVVQRYACKGPVQGRLLYRGYNDVYTIADDSGRRALRVWRANSRSMGAVLQELDFLSYLRAHKVPVSTPLLTNDQQTHFILKSPEGDRPAVLYSWAPGRKFGEQLDVATAEKIGSLFAELHLAAKAYRSPDPVAIDPVALIRDNLPFMLEWVAERPEDVSDYTLLAERLPERIRRLERLDLPRGMCHQDMHPSNVHVTPEGAITFIDFDGCAEGYWLLDVKNFVFGNAFYGYAPVYGEAFERGYNRVRPYTADEIANGEFLLLMKAFRLLGGAARTTKSRGRDLLRLRTLDWFAEYIKTRARILGLL